MGGWMSWFGLKAPTYGEWSCLYIHIRALLAKEPQVPKIITFLRVSIMMGKRKVVRCGRAELLVIRSLG
jgi:hypothetical protein